MDFPGNIQIFLSHLMQHKHISRTFSPHFLNKIFSMLIHHEANNPKFHLLFKIQFYLLEMK